MEIFFKPILSWVQHKLVPLTIAIKAVEIDKLDILKYLLFVMICVKNLEA